MKEDLTELGISIQEGIKRLVERQTNTEIIHHPLSSDARCMVNDGRKEIKKKLEGMISRNVENWCHP